MTKVENVARNQAGYEVERDRERETLYTRFLKLAYKKNLQDA
jgi:hypothetical protein